MIIITVVAVVDDDIYTLPSPRAFFAFLFTERLFTTISEPGTGYPTIHFKFITKCNSFFITKFDMYNKVRQFYYKVRQNTRSSSPVSSLFAE